MHSPSTNTARSLEPPRPSGVAQPSVSASLAKLEDQIGLQLFIRHHAQGVTASPQGARFLTEARNLLNQAQDLQRQSEAAGTMIEGTLSIGSFTTIAPAFAPQIISQFMGLHQKVHLRLEEGTQQHLFEGLRGGRYDLALLYSVDLPDEFIATPLASLAPHVLLPQHHPLAKRKRIALRDLAAEPFVLLDIPPSRTYFLRILKSAGIEPKIAFASPSLEIVRGLVAQGLGYSILIMRPHGDRSYDGEPLAIRAIAENVEPGLIVLATIRQMRKTRLVLAFEEHCVSYFNARDGKK